MGGGVAVVPLAGGGGETEPAGRPGNVHANGSPRQSLLEAVFHESKEDATGGGEKEGEPYQIRENSRGQEKGPTHQKGGSRQERLRRNPSSCQLTLEFVQYPDPLRPDQRGAQHPREEDGGKGRPEPDPPSHLNEEDQLQKGHQNEERKEPAHGGGVSS